MSLSITAPLVFTGLIPTFMITKYRPTFLNSHCMTAADPLHEIINYFDTFSKVKLKSQITVH